MTEKDWIDSIGGNVGEEFRDSLTSFQSLDKFVTNHPLQAEQIAYSYRTTFQTPQPTLEKILNNHKYTLPYMMEKQKARINIKIGGREYLIIIALVLAVVALIILG